MFNETKFEKIHLQNKMNTKDLWRIAILKRIKLQNTVHGKQITSLAGIKRKFSIVRETR